MDSFAADIAAVLTRELRAFRREIELFADDSGVWNTVPGIANSAGNLALHVCGNLRHFVGAVLGRTGYVRDRDREFAQHGMSRTELVRQIDDTIRVLGDVMPKIDARALDDEYPEMVGGRRLPARLFFIHTATHLAHHLGQAGYLRRFLTGDPRSAKPVSVAELPGASR